MAALTRRQLLTASGAYNGFFVLLLAAHVVRLLTLTPPWDQYIAAWVVLNTLALGVNAFAIKTPAPQIIPPTCPYCKEILRVGTYRCPTHGNLQVEREG